MQRHRVWPRSPQCAAVLQHHSCIVCALASNQLPILLQPAVWGTWVELLKTKVELFILHLALLEVQFNPYWFAFRLQTSEPALDLAFVSPQTKGKKHDFTLREENSSNFLQLDIVFMWKPSTTSLWSNFHWGSFLKHNWNAYGRTRFPSSRENHCTQKSS